MPLSGNRWVCLLLAVICSTLASSGDVKRTCLQNVPETVAVKRCWWVICLPDKYEIRTREGQFCCLGYNPKSSKKRHYFEVSKDAECEPFCHPPCPGNSTCQPPTTCECGSSSYFYANHVDARRCKCNAGFTGNGNDRCFPVCPDHCTNGNCNGNQCTCEPGYKRNDLEMCVPQCDTDCVPGKRCTGHNVCSPKACPETGFERNETGECVPKCVDCENGVCIGPDKCNCTEGYTLSNATGKCEARCTNCTNGLCVMPDECMCDRGFHAEDGDCVACGLGGCPGTDGSEAPLEMGGGDSSWLWWGIVLGLAVVGVVAAVGYYASKRAAKSNERKTQPAIELAKVPRPICPLPVDDDDDYIEENSLYGTI